MLVRSHPGSYFESARTFTTLRLPLPGHLARTAGENFQTPRLPATAQDGNHRARAKLDHLLPSAASSCAPRREPKMSARLRANRPGIEARSSEARKATSEFLRTARRLHTSHNPKKNKCSKTRSRSFAVITARSVMLARSLKIQTELKLT
jgi:hypothetical protein